MKVHRHKLQITTKHELDVVDITADVEKAVIDSEIQNGLAVVYSPHTTCAVVINEKETGLLADFRRMLKQMVPADDAYLHDDFDIRTENLHPGETKNAHAHLQQFLAGRTSESVIVSDGSLVLGIWQRVMVVDFDRARDREILIQVIGV